MNAHAGREAFEVRPDTRGSNTAHILLGAALAGGAVLASMAMARRHEKALDEEEYMVGYAEMHEPVMNKPKALTTLVLPPLFIALTLSGLRVWNSPVSPTRTRALTLWSLVQAFNGVWLAMGPNRLGGKLTAATASIGASVAYALEARKISAPVSALASPYLGWMGFANVITDQLLKRKVGA